MTSYRITLTDEERALLIELRRDYRPQREIADRIGVDVVIIRREMRQLGLPARKLRPWSPDEDAKLLAIEWPIPAPVLMGIFPGRSRDSINQRAIRLGVRLRTNGTVPFTDNENRIIRRHFGIDPVRQWLHLLPGRSATCVLRHARLLGLKSDLPRFNRLKSRSFRTTGHTTHSPQSG